MSIQSFVLRRCASTSSSGLLANSGLKWDQFNCGIGPGWTGGTPGCAGGTAGVGGAGGTGDTSGGTTGVAEVQVVIHQPFWFMVSILKKIIWPYICSNQLKIMENEISYTTLIYTCPYKTWKNKI